MSTTEWHGDYDGDDPTIDEYDELVADLRVVASQEQAAVIARQAAFLSEVRCLSHEIQKVSMTGMGGERLLQANRLWNELHELIKLGDPRP